MEIINTGYTLQKERTLFKGGSSKKVEVPAFAFFFEYLGKRILFDTGYSNQFIEHTTSFPNSLYRCITPVKQIHSVKDQLIQKGIEPNSVDHIIISHFHADHISGLKDFPSATFITSKQAYDAVKNLKRIQALAKAFIPELLPQDFEDRVSFIDSEKVTLPTYCTPFEAGYEVFKGSEMYAIELPGHATGQFGVIVSDMLLAADASFAPQNYVEKQLPSPVTKLIHEDWSSYKKTIEKLHEAYKNNNLKILLSHSTP